MSAPPVRFEEVAYNYGFIPVEPLSHRGYCIVYRLFKECVDEPGKVVLIQGNERVIQMKDISGPLEEREKITIFSQDIVDYYPFNFKSKAVGFLIEARRRSRTGYWFIVFQRESQLAAFCSFLYWLINGEVPRQGRSLSPHRIPGSPNNYHRTKPRERSRPRSQAYLPYSNRQVSRRRGRTSTAVSYNPSNLVVHRSRSYRSPISTSSPEYTHYEKSVSHRRSSSIRHSWYH